MKIIDNNKNLYLLSADTKKTHYSYDAYLLPTLESIVRGTLNIHIPAVFLKNKTDHREIS
ncbi:hypothetical protein DDI_3155 [Dickeya dianthicola RNS04.9]|nr:hypothetical protein DDI_3155 [Dickeya dianthicola RNS04.9]